MMFNTGLEELLEKIAAGFTNPRPAVSSPWARAPRQPLPAQTSPGQARYQAATNAYAQRVQSQAHDPVMREVMQMGQKNFEQQPQAAPAAAAGSTAARPGFWSRAAIPIGLAAGGAMLGAHLMSGYNDDQRYNNLAYTPLGPNAV